MDNPIEEVAVKLVREHCSSFVERSDGLPLLKNLSPSYNIFDRVKVRQRSVRSSVTESFNEAFKIFRPNFYQTSVFANSEDRIQVVDGKEQYYVFPLDGFQFLYCEQIGNTDEQYQEAFGKLLELLNNDHAMVRSVICELLQQTYKNDDLPAAIAAGSEILFFNVPYFYVLKKAHVPNYKLFIEQVLQ